MEDLISRQAVMDCFKKWQPYLATRLWDFEQELSALPSVKPQEPKWIPVSERLPKPNEYVGNVCRYCLIQNEYRDMMVARWDGQGWEQMYQYGEYIEDEVIAWMPLPPCYEPQESEDNE